MGSDGGYFLAEDANTKPPYDTFACLNKICPAATHPYCPDICKQEAEGALMAGQLEIIVNNILGS